MNNEERLEVGGTTASECEVDKQKEGPIEFGGLGLGPALKSLFLPCCHSVDSVDSGSVAQLPII